MEKPDEIKYVSPKEAMIEDDLTHHRLDLIIDDKKIGSAEINYFSKPLPMYVLSDLYVDYDQKGKGYASKIMERVEKFLVERRKPGFLADAIFDDDPAKGMYAKRGWIEIPEDIAGVKGTYVYNWSEDVPLEILRAHQFRYSTISERDENREVA